MQAGRPPSEFLATAQEKPGLPAEEEPSAAPELRQTGTVRSDPQLPCRPKPDQPERRREPRRTADGGRAVVVDLGPTESGILVNLSATGIMVEGSHRLAPGLRLVVRFQLPATGTVISPSYEVAWTGEGKAGLKFLSISDGDKRKLDQWLRVHASPAGTVNPLAARTIEVLTPPFSGSHELPGSASEGQFRPAQPGTEITDFGPTDGRPHGGPRSR